MRARVFVPLAIVVTAACAAGTDTPTSPHPPSFSKAVGNPPPPPLDTESVSIDIRYDGAALVASARYFVNRPGTNAWIQFASNAQVIATPNARLQYNVKADRTIGAGTLTSSYEGRSVVLDLSHVTIVNRYGSSQPFRSCNEGYCGSAVFTTDGGQGGLIVVTTRPTANQ